MFNGIALTVLFLPYLLMALLSVECTNLRANNQACEDESAMAQTVQHITTVAFAWLATPPR